MKGGWLQVQHSAVPPVCVGGEPGVVPPAPLCDQLQYLITEGKGTWGAIILKEDFWVFFYNTLLNTALSGAPDISLCHRMLRLKAGQLRRQHW
jgi:hypothetical protein